MAGFARFRAAALGACVLLTACLVQAEDKMVVCIGGFLDETNSPLVDHIRQIQSLTGEYLNRMGVVEHQSIADIESMKSAREFMQLATGSGKLEDLEKIAAKGIDKFIYLELVQELAAMGLVDALYGLVVDVETREFSVVPLGSYNNKVGTAQMPKDKMMRKVKIAKKLDQAAERAAGVLSVYLTLNNRNARDLLYTLEDHRSAMKRNSYGKGIGMTLAGGLMLGGMQTAVYFMDEGGNSHEYLVGALDIISIAYALPAAIGVGNIGKRIGMGIKYQRLQRRYKALTGVKYEMPEPKD